jgi:hypothetical protein
MVTLQENDVCQPFQASQEFIYVNHTCTWKNEPSIRSFLHPHQGPLPISLQSE